MSTKRVLIVLLLAFVAWQWYGHRAALPVPATAGTTAPTPAARGDAQPTAAVDRSLPAEAQATLRLIASHGPFPYDRDGVVFGNFEHRLPEQPRGYYREYTVPTSGAHNRGARRIVTGGDPPRDYYYTDDHYQSFRQIEAQP